MRSVCLFVNSARFISQPKPNRDTQNQYKKNSAFLRQPINHDLLELPGIKNTPALYFLGRLEETRKKKQEIEKAIHSLIQAHQAYAECFVKGAEDKDYENAREAIKRTQGILQATLEQSPAALLNSIFEAKCGSLNLRDTPLNLFIYFPSPNVIQYLLANKQVNIDFNKINSFGYTPLTMADEVLTNFQLNHWLVKGAEDPAKYDPFYNDRLDILEMLEEHLQEKSMPVSQPVAIRESSSPKTTGQPKREKDPLPSRDKKVSNRATTANGTGQTNPSKKKRPETGRQRLEKKERDRKQAEQDQQEAKRLQRKKEREAEERQKAEFEARIQTLKDDLSRTERPDKSIAHKTTSQKRMDKIRPDQTQASQPHAYERPAVKIGHHRRQRTAQKTDTAGKRMPLPAEQQTKNKEQTENPKEALKPISCWTTHWETKQPDAAPEPQKVSSPLVDEFGSPTTLVGSFDSSSFDVPLPQPEDRDTSHAERKKHQIDSPSLPISSPIYTSHSSQIGATFSPPNEPLSGLMIMNAMQNAQKTMLGAQVTMDDQNRTIGRQRRKMTHSQQIIEQEKLYRQTLQRSEEAKTANIEGLKLALSKRIAQAHDLLQKNKLTEKKLRELEMQFEAFKLNQVGHGDDGYEPSQALPVSQLEHGNEQQEYYSDDGYRSSESAKSTKSQPDYRGKHHRAIRQNPFMMEHA